MLEAIRKRTGSIVVKLLLGFLMLSFGAWGIGDYIQGNAANTAAVTVGDREVSVQQVSNAFRRQLNQIRRYLGADATMEGMRTLGLDREIINNLVQAELLSLAAHSHGLVVSDDAVRAGIQRMPAFSGLTGTFDHDVFRQTIANAGYSENEFIELIRDETKQGIVLGSLNAGVSVPEVLAQRIHAFRHETRRAQFVKIPDSMFRDVAMPGESAIVTYHETNQSKFMAPEYRDVTYIHLQAGDLADGIDVNEQDIEDAYLDREDEFVSIARRNVDQGIFKNEEQSQRALQMLTEGTGFADAVSEVAGSPIDSLGWVTRSDLLGSDTADSVFAGTAGDVVGPVKSPLGWHLFKIVEAEEEIRQTLDEVRDGLRSELATERALDDLFEMANELEDLLASGMTLEEAGGTMNVASPSVAFLSQGGVDAMANVVPDLPGEGFLSTVFATDEGTESALVESGDDAYFIVRVNGTTASALRPLTTVRDAVVASILAERRTEQARAIAEEISDGLRVGSDLRAVSTEYADVVVHGEGIRRDGAGLPDGIPAAMASALFTADIGDGVYVRGDGYYVIGHLFGVSAATLDKTSAPYEALVRELAQGMRGDITQQISDALLRRFPVSINETAVRQAQGIY